ncbi:MAG: hypothetical protein ACJ75B_12365 [Flavisolibacter sp.]
MKKTLLVIAVSLSLFACDKEKNKENVFKSDEVAVHGGKAWSTITLDKKDVPQQLSLVLNDAVLNSVPIGGIGDGHDGMHGNDLFAPLHSKALATTPFQTIMLNWNQNGHEPAGVYDRPHFDFHFYTTTSTEVMAYTDPVKMDQNIPSASYVPANYVAGPGVPMMGKHWIDVNTPELHGQPFTQTLLYGSYDSKTVFVEPMITLEFLKTTSNFERDIPQPAKFQKAGYYPTKLNIVKHDGVTEIRLEGFKYQKAG